MNFFMNDTNLQIPVTTAPSSNTPPMNVGPASPKSLFGTMLLCGFLGYLGIHRFYVGKIVSGILMLLTFGGLGLWWSIDFILVTAGAFKDKDGLPVKPIDNSKTHSPKSFLATLLLCQSLGLLGIHRFYVGKIVSGILMLLTFGGLGLWLIIDLAMIAGGIFRDKHGLPVKR